MSLMSKRPQLMAIMKVPLDRRRHHRTQMSKDASTSLERIVLFVVLLVIWAVGTAALYFLSLLSISPTFIYTLLGISAVCLLIATTCFFARWMAAAFLVASGPLLIVGGLLGLVRLSGLIHS